MRGERGVKRQESLTGYQLHDARIAFAADGTASKNEAVRTIKFPLFAEGSQIRRAFECIKHDYLMLHGPMAYHDWLKGPADATGTNYSCLDFWLDALLIGGVFQSSDAEIKKLALQVSGDDPILDLKKSIEKECSPNILDSIDWNGLSEFLSKDSRANAVGCFKMQARNLPEICENLRRYTALKEELKTNKEYNNADNKDSFLRKLRLNILLNIEEPAGGDDSSISKSDLALTFLLLPQSLLNEVDVRVIKPIENSESIDSNGSIVRKLGRNIAAETACLFAARLSKNQLGEMRLPKEIREGFQSNKEQQKFAAELMGLSKNFNALSNFFNVFFEELIRSPASCAEAMLNRYPPLTRNALRADFIERCEVLSRLGRSLNSAQAASSRAEYRSFVGGEIQSWYSNRQRHLEELFEQLGKKKTALKSTTIAVDSTTKKTKSDAERTQLLDLQSMIGECCKVVDQLLNQKELLAPDELPRFIVRYQLVADLLGDINQTVNEICQSIPDFEVALKQESLNERLDNDSKQRKVVKKESSKRHINLKDNKILATLSSPLRQYPAFLGESKRQRYSKFKLSPLLLIHLIDLLRRSFPVPQTKSKIAPSPEIAERILRWVAETANYGSIEEKRLGLSEVPISAFLPLRKFATRRQRYFYKSRYSSDRRTPKLSEVETGIWIKAHPGIEITRIYEWLLREIDLVDLEIKAGNKQLTAYFKSLLKLWPMLIGLLSESNVDFRNSTFCLFFENLKQFLLLTHNQTVFSELFPGISGYLDLVQSEISKDSLNEPAIKRLISRTFSEASGLITSIGYTSFVARYSLQQQNGAQANLFQSGDNIDSERYLIELPYIKGDQDTLPGIRCVCRGNKTSNEGLKTYRPKGLVFEIRSSRYQIQFLRWFRKRPKNKHCTLDIGGSFLIAEEDVPLRANWESGEMECLEVDPTAAQKASIRLFSSIPFTLRADNKKVETSLQSLRPITADAVSGRVIGVDIGEYALAYTVIEWRRTGSNLSIQTIETGNRLMSEGAHRVLKDEVVRLKRRQARGAFLFASNAVANIRETLIGAYRAKLHDLVIRHNAPLVFEYNVSAFEAGGNQIKKIYNSIKTADSKQDNRSDRDLRAHYWGKAAKWRSKDGGWITGFDIGAAQTSQLCSKCRRVANKWIDEHLGKNGIYSGHKPEKILGTREEYLWHQFHVGEVQLRAFLKKQQSIETISSLKRAVHDIARPPLKRFYRSLPKAAKKRRGNSSLFWCPFIDCGHVSDCDVQASFVIALKGVIRKLWPEEAEYDGWLNIVKDRERIRFQPTPLDPKQFRNIYGSNQTPQARKINSSKGEDGIEIDTP